MQTIISTVALITLFTTNLAFSQGELTPPPGAPAPTMKTLDQIEARTPIPEGTPSWDPGPHFIITQPGSYYLTGNVEVGAGHGIVINSSNVTLDLNGFALISKTESPALGSAVLLGANVTGIIIKNGTITGGATRTPNGPNPWNASYLNQGWGYGIEDTTGSPAMGVLISHVTIVSCRVNAISLDGPSVIQNVVATGNGDGGIRVKDGNVVQSSSTRNGGTGITVFTGSVTDCFVSNNQNWGIYVTDGIVSNSVAKANGSVGIEAFSGAVNGCHTTSNFKSGIYVGTGVAAHCVAYSNSIDPTTTDKNITVFATGQRVGCVPISE